MTRSRGPLFGWCRYAGPCRCGCGRDNRAVGVWQTGEGPRKGDDRPLYHPERYNQKSLMKVSVILPAAGLGTRMGREKSGVSRKQFMLLEGAPILIHTIRKFLRCPLVTEIVVALRGEDLDWARGLVHTEHPSRPVRFVGRRHASTIRGERPGNDRAGHGSGRRP